MQSMIQNHTFHPVLLWILAVLSIVSACSESPMQPVTPPDGVEKWTSSEVNGVQVIAASRLCVLLDDGDDLPGADPSTWPQEIATEYGLQIVEVFGPGSLVLYEGTPDLIALGNDVRVRAVQGNESTVLGRPVEVIMGFYEGDWEDAGLPLQDALEYLQLPLLQRRMRGAGARVAVLDTGVDPSHPLLSSRVELLDPQTSVLTSEEVEMGVDTDGDGVFDEAYGHGTHVAGIVSTIAPEATIIPIRVLDSDGVGDPFTIAMGLYTAQTLGANVINLSLVFADETNVVEHVLDDLERSGIVIIGAGGNQPGEALFPATDSNVLGVGATDAAGNVASFSASRDLRLLAPGVGIESAYPGEQIAWASGTSMACAVVSGCVALFGGFTDDYAKSVTALTETAIEIENVDGRRLDPVGAIRYLRRPMIINRQPILGLP